MYSSGKGFTVSELEWLVPGSYYNLCIIEPEQITVQFPGGFYEARDHDYIIMKIP
jgi:hypothetical protein